MIPGARLQAVIDLLDIFQSKRAPFDNIIKDWARQNRYAGSKDRAFISETAFAIMRRYGECAHAMQNEASRSLVLGYLALQDATDLNELHQLFNGEGYNPPALSEDEAAAYQIALNATPAAMATNIPEAYRDPSLYEHQGEVATFWQSLSRRAPLDIRVNTLKATRDDVVLALTNLGHKVETSALSPWGIRVQPKDDGRYVNLRGQDLYTKGLVEIQDQGTQVASALVDARPHMQILDICAGAGGKSLALAATMENTGQILATDIAIPRLKQMALRVKRASIHNLQTKHIHAWDGKGIDPDFADQTGTFDRVVLDVPCSGSGVWRRQPDAKWRLSESDMSRYCAAQKEIIRRAAPLVKPEGRLVYITCSVFKSENSAQVQDFLAEHPDFTTVDVTQLGASLGLSAWPQNSLTEDGFLQLSPESGKDSETCDGTFVAVLKRER